jgi:hypothetical protein
MVIIESIEQEPIPGGKNEKWWEQSLEYELPSVKPSQSTEATTSTVSNLKQDEEDYDFCKKDVAVDCPDEYTTVPPQRFDGIRRQVGNHEDIDFLRPDGSIEGKGIDWCLSNDFFQIEEGLWSGPWFYDTYPAAKVVHEERIKRTEQIRSICESSSPYTSDADAFGYGYGYDYDSLEYCDMEGGRCTCKRKRRVSAEEEERRKNMQKYVDECKRRRIEEELAKLEKIRKRHREEEAARAKKGKKPKPGSQEYIDSKVNNLLDRVKRWSGGDEDAVARAKEVTEQIPWWGWTYQCPVNGCNNRLPSQETLDLHKMECRKRRLETGAAKPKKKKKRKIKSSTGAGNVVVRK